MQNIKNSFTDRQIPRQSNFELLRIFSMIIIVAHHFSVHGGFEFSNDSITFNRLWIQFITIGGKIGINIFVLISGYFLISSKTLKTSKIMKFWLQIFTYSIIIFVVFTATGIEPFGIKELIKHCFPVTFLQWWFVSTYFVLYLIFPYLNMLLNSFSKKSYQRFLLLLTVCWCIVPTLTGKLFESNSLLWFLYLYACAGYIKLHGPKTNIKGATYILLSFAITFLTFLSAVIFDILGTKVSFFGDHATFFFKKNSLPIFVASVLLFIGFSKINIGCKRIINIVSSATFGVYLIHDNQYVSNFLWSTLFKNASYSDNNLLAPYSLLVIAIVYISCTIIELARIYLIEKHYMNAINSIAKGVDNCMEKFLSLNIFNK